DLATREDLAGIEASRQAIEALIGREIERGVAAERIRLAGFSQGGAIAVRSGLRYPQRLAGSMALSTYVPLRHSLSSQAAAAYRHIPIFKAHGDSDPVVPITLGQASRDLLGQQGYNVEWHAYPMQHQVCMQEIRAIGAWLQGVLS